MTEEKQFVPLGAKTGKAGIQLVASIFGVVVTVFGPYGGRYKGGRFTAEQAEQLGIELIQAAARSRVLRATKKPKLKRVA